MPHPYDLYLLSKLQQFILLSQWSAILPYLISERPRQKAAKAKALLEGTSETKEAETSPSPEELERINSDLFWNDSPEPVSLWTSFWNKFHEVIIAPEATPICIHVLAVGIIVYSCYTITVYNRLKKLAYEEAEATPEAETTPASEPIHVMPSYIEESIQLDGCLNPVLFDSISQVFF